MSTEGRGGALNSSSDGGEWWRPVVDGRPDRPPLTPLFMSPWGRAAAPPRAPAAPPRGPLPLNDSPQGGAGKTAPRGGGGGAILGALLLANRARLAGPAPDARPRPWHPTTVSTARRRRVPPCPRRERPHDRGRPPLAMTGAAPGPHTGEPAGQPSWPARHTRAGPPPWLWAAGTATPLEEGIVTVRHIAPTLGEPDFPEVCPTTAYFKLFRWRPTCDHLVAHQAQPRSQYFPGIRSPPGRAPP